MLILNRQIGEVILIGDGIEVEVEKGHVKFGFNAPKEVQIYREELVDKIKPDASDL